MFFLCPRHSFVAFRINFQLLSKGLASVSFLLSFLCRFVRICYDDTVQFVLFEVLFSCDIFVFIFVLFLHVFRVTIHFKEKRNPHKITLLSVRLSVYQSSLSQERLDISSLNSNHILKSTTP